MLVGAEEMKLSICRTDLREVIESVQERKGLVDRFKPYKPGTTEPWLQLERIGLSSKSVNEDYTGPIPLYIQDGGVLNIKDLGKLPIIMEDEVARLSDEGRIRYPGSRSTGIDLVRLKQARKAEALKKSSTYEREIKTLFKTYVLPSIKDFAPECGDSFILNLHYSHRELFKVDIHRGDTDK